MAITINHVGKNRATHCGKRYVIAFGRLYGEPTSGSHRDPQMDAVFSPYGDTLFAVRAGETCAEALTRYFAESQKIILN